VPKATQRNKYLVTNKSETKTTWRAECRYRPGIGRAD
jgi:hypothetical protein